MVLGSKSVYLLLFLLTLLAVIAGSSAVMVLAGKGQTVIIFAMGMTVGMALSGAVSLELYQLGMAWFATVFALRDTSLRLFLSQRDKAIATPQNASDVQLEIECRRLLDRTGQLLDLLVDEDGCCRYCCEATHEESCPVLAAAQLYEKGKARRVPWQEFEKTLPHDVV